MTTTLVLLGGCGDDEEARRPLRGSDRDADVDAAQSPRDAGSSVEDELPVPPSDWRPLDRDAVYEGKSLEEWVLEWAHWSMSQTSCESPEQDGDGALCTLYQIAASPVFFFASGEYETHRTRCRVSAGKAILVPLTQFTSDPDEVPADDWFTDATPEERARQVQGSMRDVNLRVDGSTLENLDAYSIGPLAFAHTFPKGRNYYSCYEPPLEIEGTFEPLYIVGYFALFPPPSVGRHRLEYGGSLSYPNYDYTQQVSSTFVVE